MNVAFLSPESFSRQSVSPSFPFELPAPTTVARHAADLLRRPTYGATLNLLHLFCASNKPCIQREVSAVSQIAAPQGWRGLI
eukprot:2095050-Pyramimonas_sp.AAC.1